MDQNPKARRPGSPRQIAGSARLYGVLADPMAHARSPRALKALFAEIGFDGVMVPMHVAAHDRARVVASLRRVRSLDGWVVTAPHRTAIAGRVDEVSDAARAIGALVGAPS